MAVMPLLVAGMSKELNMSATDYSTALSIFFVSLPVSI